MAGKLICQPIYFIMKKVLILLLLLSNLIFSQSFNEIDSLKNLNTLPIKHKIKLSDFDPLSQKIDYYMLGAIGAVTTASVISINNYYKNSWWQEQSTDFKVVHDWEYALWIDKIGHFYATYLIAHGFSAGLEAANFSIENSYLYGGLAALALQLYVEVQDGYGPKWGFSPGDAISDVLGAGFAIGQYYYPFLKNFHPRVSYWPSDEYLNGKKEDGNISDDYEGQKIWLSFRMKNLLPKDIAEDWPSWLMLSVGYGVHNLDGKGDGDKEFHIAFDLDAEEIIPFKGKGWQFIINTLNYIHFPMPGIKIYKGKVSLSFGYSGVLD